jgi:hypothetical protein
MTVIDPAVTLQVSDNDKVLEPYRSAADARRKRFAASGRCA